MLATNPVVFGWEQLLGRHEVETPERIRGAGAAHAPPKRTPGQARIGYGRIAASHE